MLYQLKTPNGDTNPRPLDNFTMRNNQFFLSDPKD